MKTELVTTLKRKATALLADLRASREAVLITEHGKPSAYLVDVDTYDLLQSRMNILEGIARGEKAIQDGKTVSKKQARQRMQRWLA